MGRGGGCIMKDVGGVLPGDFTQKFIDSVPGAAYLKFTLRANGNSVPPEQILDPDEERVVKVVAGQERNSGQKNQTTHLAKADYGNVHVIMRQLMSHESNSHFFHWNVITV